jgi:glutamyl-tRNA synthetase
MVDAFDIADVNPNPARFDLKKAEAINATHVRMLAPEDFRDRLVPYLHAAGVVPAASFAQLPAAQREILTAAAPLTQERMVLLGECVGMLGFLFVPDEELVIADDARAALREDAREIIAVAVGALDALDDFTAGPIQEVLRAAIVDGMGVKPKFAFTPLRVALTGRRVSPPLFESMEILGKESTLARLAGLRDAL